MTTAGPDPRFHARGGDGCRSTRSRPKGAIGGAHPSPTRSQTQTRLVLKIGRGHQVSRGFESHPRRSPPRWRMVEPQPTLSCLATIPLSIGPPHRSGSPVRAHDSTPRALHAPTRSDAFLRPMVEPIPRCDDGGQKVSVTDPSRTATIDLRAWGAPRGRASARSISATRHLWTPSPQRRGGAIRQP